MATLFQTLTISTAAILGTVPFHTASVRAATLNYSFAVDVTRGSLTGTTGTGDFSFDDTTLTKIGLETFNLSKGLLVNFNFLGTNYIESQDYQFPDYPLVGFQDGALVGLNFAAGPIFIGNETFPVFGNGGAIFSFVDSLGKSIGTVTYSSSAVPEPSEVGGAALAIGFFWLAQQRMTKRRRQAKRDLEKGFDT